MPIGNWNLEWLDHNSQRAWPIAEDATAKDTTGSFTLPTDFLVDLAIDVPVDANVLPAKFFLKQLGATPTGFTVTFGYDATGGAVDVATFSFTRAAHEINAPYPLIGIGNFVDITGHAVIGRLENIDRQPQGFFTFDLTGGRLEVEPIRPKAKVVSALRIRNGQTLSLRLQNVIEFVAGSNMRITATPETETANAQIRFDAISGEGLLADCDCTDEQVGPPIRFINLVGPDANGNIDLIAGTCVSLESLESGFRINDTCSSPCCGCPELEKLTADLTAVLQGQRTLQTFLTRLESSVQQTDQVILGSRILDNGCF